MPTSQGRKGVFQPVLHRSRVGGVHLGGSLKAPPQDGQELQSLWTGKSEWHLGMSGGLCKGDRPCPRLQP